MTTTKIKEVYKKKYSYQLDDKEAELILEFVTALIEEDKAEA